MPKNPPVPELEQQLAQLELSLLEQYCEAGKSLLEAAEQQNRRIGETVDSIITLRRRLALEKNCLHCPTCTKINEPDSHYCRYCGCRLEQNNQI